MKANELIKLYRKQCKLTQEQLAQKIGTTQDTISLWELGKSKPDFDSIRQLCIIFGISADELLEIETENQRKQVKIFNSFNTMNGNNNRITF